MAVHPNSLKNLSPENGWRPGQSGNPGGLPKGTPKVSVALAKLLRCGVGEDYQIVNRADEIALSLYEKAKGGDVQAIGMVFDRIEGKLSQTLNLTASSQSDQELARQMFEELIQGGKEPEQARALLLEVGVNASDLD